MNILFFLIIVQKIFWPLLKLIKQCVYIIIGFIQIRYNLTSTESIIWQIFLKFFSFYKFTENVDIII